MTIIREASTIYASMFSLVLFMILFESRYPRKRTMILTLTLMVPLMIVNFVLLIILGPVVMSTLLLITCSLPSLVFFWILAKHRDGRFFFTFCFADTIMLEVIDLTSVLDFFLGNTYLFMAVSRLLLCPVLAFTIFKWIQPLYLDLQNKVTKGWYTLAAIALIFYVLLSLSISVPTHITQRLNQLPAFLLLLTLVPLIYLHFFRTLIHQQRSHEMAQQENILQLQVDNMRSRIDEFSAANEQLREERHDFRHKMRTVSVLAEKGDLEAIRQTAMEYTDSAPDLAVETYCSHAVLDAVFSSYLEWAKRKNIRVSAKLIFPEVLPVNEAELATALANAIENAIHACEKLEPSKRYIEIKSIVYPCFMLQIRNSFDGIVAFDGDGIPLSAKKGHGFGTRSIVTFCEKNNVFCSFSAEDQAFTMQLVFN